MPSFTLPSGRVVETHEPTFGEEVHVVNVGSANIEDLIYAKFAVTGRGARPASVNCSSSA